MRLKELIAKINFQFELGNRIINNVRSVMILLIFIRVYEIPEFLYVPIFIVTGFLIWFIGFILDKKKFYYDIDNSTYERGKLGETLEIIKKYIDEQGSNSVRQRG